MRSNRTLPALCVAPLLFAIACDRRSPKTDTSLSGLAAAPAGTPARHDKLPRHAFNRYAAELALPLFWTEDRDRDGALDPDELAVYWGLEKGASLAQYVQGGKPTPKLLAAYDQIVAQSKEPKKGDARIEAVKKELAQGQVTLVATDLSKASADDKAFVAAILRAAAIIEVLYAKQQGIAELASKIPPSDPASRTLLFRAQGPKCEAPLTVHDKDCSALGAADLPKGFVSGLYPQDLLGNPKFCEELAKKDKALSDPFTVVRRAGSELKAVPYNEAWPAELQAVAKELEGAARALGTKEAALREYLGAAAKAFRDNQWWPADEAWARMDAKSSKYYLRIAPDEVYREPCSTKALFHVSFGLVNQGSLKWQQKLDPLKNEMEAALAALAGPPYEAREVSFKIPDFVDIALNAGDSRKAFGATVGQSLPNFGPVANGGRGRTVAMTNFYTDPDSLAIHREQAASLFCKETMAKWTDSPEAQLMGTVLHEAAHNLGPAHQYKASGKTDREAFGGPLASTLEELKAQTAALHFTEWLIEKKEITREDADKAHVRDVFWAFGQLSRGMYDADKHPNNYAQLAAVQVLAFSEAGALPWRAGEPAANGKDKGCFAIDFAKLPGSIRSLMADVARIKARGDKARAEGLLAQYVDVTGERKRLHEVITERMTRAPKASFVYDVKLD